VTGPQQIAGLAVQAEKVEFELGRGLGHAESAAASGSAPATATARMGSAVTATGPGHRSRLGRRGVVLYLGINGCLEEYFVAPNHRRRIGRVPFELDLPFDILRFAPL